MKIKTSELKGAALDWAVAKAWQPVYSDGAILVAVVQGDYHPSTDWSFGGPIIEREKITIMCPSTGDFWDARVNTFPPVYWRGETPLIAAMRCYVASKLGDEVEIPEELVA